MQNKAQIKSLLFHALRERKERRPRFKQRSATRDARQMTTQISLAQFERAKSALPAALAACGQLHAIERVAPVLYVGIARNNALSNCHGRRVALRSSVHLQEQVAHQRNPLVEIKTP